MGDMCKGGKLERDFLEGCKSKIYVGDCDDIFS